VTGIQPELWVDRAGAAVTFYEAAFGARVLLRVGEGDDIVAQLGVDDAVFWVSAASDGGPRFSPPAIGGTTGRTLLVVDDPDAFAARAMAAGASSSPRSPTSTDGGWDGSRTPSVTSGRSAGHSPDRRDLCEHLFA
jgi:PhnB protein